MKVYGLVGKDIEYSFSKKYFTDYFMKSGIESCIYNNFSLENLKDFQELIEQNPNLAGLNVTIPYKEAIIPYLQSLSKKAAAIGAVNVIKFQKNGKLKGYNSDCFGFKKSIKPLLKPYHRQALILGTGGSFKAVAYALTEMDIKYVAVSRTKQSNYLTYEELTAKTFEDFQIIVNCTPVGTYPLVEQCPPIPYQYFTEKHLAYDLIYNPEETAFLNKAKQYGALIKNGKDMLIYQAEKSWEIWNK
jgi:shikimate dehydrogenase